METAIAVIGSFIILICATNLLCSVFKYYDLDWLKINLASQNNPPENIFNIRIEYSVFPNIYTGICEYLNKIPKKSGIPWYPQLVDNNGKIFLVPQNCIITALVNGEKIKFQFLNLDNKSDIMDTIDITCPSRKSCDLFINQLKNYITNSDWEGLKKDFENWTALNIIW